MTNYNNTDKIIREKYDALDPVFDAEAMWAELSPIVEQKKRRGFFFWILSGVLVFTVSMLVNGLFDPENKSSNLADAIYVNDSGAGNIIDDNRNDVLSIQYSKELTEEIIISSSNEEFIESVKDDITIQSNHRTETSFLINQDSKRNLLNENQLSNFTYDKQQVYQSDTQDEFTQIHISLESKSSKSVATINEEKQGRELVSLSSLAFFNISSLKYSRNKVLITNFEFEKSISTEPLLTNQWRVGVSGGYYLHSRSFDNIGDDVSDNYSSRSMEEKAKDGYDLGLKLEYFLSDNFVLIGGVRFSQSFVQRKANFSYSETITLMDHVVAIINTEQGPIEILEDITYDGIFNYKSDNYITATRLGLITGVQYRIGVDRWTTHVNLGVELPVWSSHSGFITNNRRPYNLSDGTEAINTSSLQIFGGLGIEYSLSASTALQATIAGYMPIKNEYVESYAIEKKSTLLGLNIGVHFRL